MGLLNAIKVYFLICILFSILANISGVLPETVDGGVWEPANLEGYLCSLGRDVLVIRAILQDMFMARKAKSS